MTKNKENKITIAVSVAAVIISVFSLYYNNINNENDIAIKREELKIKQEETKQIEIQNLLDSNLKLMTFYLDNYEKFYSKDTSVRKNMALVLESLPSDVSKEFYKKIIETTNDPIYKESYNNVVKRDKKIIVKPEETKQSQSFIVPKVNKFENYVLEEVDIPFGKDLILTKNKEGKHGLIYRKSGVEATKFIYERGAIDVNPTKCIFYNSNNEKIIYELKQFKIK